MALQNNGHDVYHFLMAFTIPQAWIFVITRITLISTETMNQDRGQKGVQVLDPVKRGTWQPAKHSSSVSRKV